MSLVQSYFIGKNVDALHLEKCVSSGIMTSAHLTLEKLKAPLEKERQLLQQTRDAILDQLKVLKVIWRFF